MAWKPEIEKLYLKNIYEHDKIKITEYEFDNIIYKLKSLVHTIKIYDRTEIITYKMDNFHQFNIYTKMKLLNMSIKEYGNIFDSVFYTRPDIYFTPFLI